MTPKMANDVVKDYFQNSVYHGMHDFYDAKNIAAKFVWAGVVLLGGFFAVTQSTDFICGYLSNDKWVTRVTTESPPDGIMPWPNMTICSQNLLDAEKLNRSGLTDPYEIAFAFDNSVGVQFYSQFQADSPLNENETLELIRKYQNLVKPDSYNDTLDDLQHSTTCENTILDCGHNHGFRDELDCDCSKLSSPGSKRHNCFKIYLQKVYKESDTFRAAGYGNGMALLLNPRLDSYYQNLLYDGKSSGGFRIRLYFKDDSMDGVNSPILLSPGTHTQIAMTARRSRTALRPRNTLQFYESSLSCTQTQQYKWINSSSPSRALCQWDCYATFLMDYCGCIFKIATIVWKNDATPCDGWHDKQCWNKIKQVGDWSSMVLGDNFTYDACVNTCKEACEQDSIATEYSMAQFPAANQLRQFTRYLNRALKVENKVYAESDAKQLIFLELFYQSNQYLLTETVNGVVLDELVSQIGGTLGVWTGLSLIGIFQVCMYFCSYVFSIVKEAYVKWSNRISPVGLTCMM